MMAAEAEPELTDLQILRMLEGGAYAAALSWTDAAAHAHDLKLRRYFSDVAGNVLDFQGQVRTLIREMGGAI